MPPRLGLCSMNPDLEGGGSSPHFDITAMAIFSKKSSVVNPTYQQKKSKVPAELTQRPQLDFRGGLGREACPDPSASGLRQHSPQLRRADGNLTHSHGARAWGTG